MALIPDHTYTTPSGVKVNMKLIPDGTVWKDAAKAQAAGFSAGSLYKKQQKLSGGTGKVKYITVHNTDDLVNIEDDGECYTRATFNENMGSARVHFYVDDLCAWQNLRAGTGKPGDLAGSAEVGWHAADGSTADGGNMTSLAIEIIMNDNNVGHDAMAYDKGARLAAWLLYINELPLSRLVTHAYWNAKKKGMGCADVDEQCVKYVAGEHWCPYYIFDSTSEAGALKNWKKFKALVGTYLAALQTPPAPANPFVDVKEGKSYYEAVLWAVANGITKGTDATHFSPDKPCTRGQMVTFLHRMDSFLKGK